MHPCENGWVVFVNVLLEKVLYDKGNQMGSVLVAKWIGGDEN